MWSWFLTRMGGDVAQLVEHRTGTPLRQVRFPGAASDFSPRVNFQCRLSYGVCTPSCAIACINICAYVKDPVVHVRVQWIMETLKHPACTVGWVARPCHSRLSQGKSCATQPTVHAGCFNVSIIHGTLTWTTGSLACAQVLLYATAHGGVQTP